MLSGTEIRSKTNAAGIPGSLVCITAGIARSRISDIERGYVTASEEELGRFDAALDNLFLAKRKIAAIAAAEGWHFGCENLRTNYGRVGRMRHGLDSRAGSVLGLVQTSRPATGTAILLKLRKGTTTMTADERVRHAGNTEPSSTVAVNSHTYEVAGLDIGTDEYNITAAWRCRTGVWSD